MHWRGLDEDAMTALAERLGALADRGTVLLLCGPMGAGKTTFVRALGRGLGLQRPDRVCSPTYNIAMVHEGPVPLMHVDLFRLAPEPGAPTPASFEALGLEPLLDRIADEQPEADPDAAVLAIEWAELWQGEPDALRLTLFRPDADHRSLLAEATGPAHAQLLARWTAGS